MQRKAFDAQYGYVADRRRLEAYAAALQRLVTTESVVADLGCGTGVLGLLACQAGALRVHAVDHSGMLDIARTVAAANGADARIVHHFGHSRTVALPERVDLVVSDQLGPMGTEAGLLGASADAARRWLKAGGRLVPDALQTWMAPMATDDVRALTRWDTRIAGLEFGILGARARQLPQPLTALPEWRADPQRLWDLDLYNLPPHPTTVGGRARWEVTSAGRCDGLAAWFSARLCEDITITNQPGHPDRLDRAAVWLPWSESVDLELGDVVTCAVVVDVISGDVHWNVTVTRDGLEVLVVDHASERGRIAEPLLSRTVDAPVAVSGADLQRVAIADTIYWNRDLHPDEPVVLFDERTSQYHALNDSASRIWRALAQRQCPGDVVRELAAAHPDDSDRIADDVDAFLRHARELGLITAAPSSAAD